MKKNKMLRLASVLLILVMLTTSIVGGTFAKYTTTGSVSDTARVAKWGVAINTSGSLYSNAYAAAAVADGKGNLPTAWNATSNVNAITVATADVADDNIVAPGTKSYDNGLSFGITGKPEVAVKVETTIQSEDIFLKGGTYGVLVEATVKDAESLEKLIRDHSDGVYKKNDAGYEKLAAGATFSPSGNYYVLTDMATVDAGGYYPVKYKLEGSVDGTNLKAKDAAEQLAKVLKNDAASTITDDRKIYKSSYTADQTYLANTDLSTAGPKFSNEKLSWEWPIGETDDDPKDTILGNLIAARGATGTPPYIVVAVDDTVGTATSLTIGTGDDYTVKDGTNAVVANLRTMLDITLTVTQVD